MYKKDYSKLYIMQDKVFAWIREKNFPFYLTGGTALGRFYLNHRFSEDLDFFVNNDVNFSKYISVIGREIYALSESIENQSIITNDFARFFIHEGDGMLKIEFVNDVPFRVGSIIKTSNVCIDSLINILSNKLTAIDGRDEPKDVFDIVLISLNYNFTWPEIFGFAREKAMIDEISVEKKLRSFPPEILIDADWIISSPDPGIFGKYLQKITDDIIMGSDNQLGIGKPLLSEATLTYNN